MEWINEIYKKQRVPMANLRVERHQELNVNKKEIEEVEVLLINRNMEKHQE